VRKNSRVVGFSQHGYLLRIGYPSHQEYARTNVLDSTSGKQHLELVYGI